MSVRLLQPGDVADAMLLSQAANWNQVPADWHRMLRLAPESCWCIELDGRIVATTTLITFESLGWIGMVLTHPEYRRQGLARELMEHALAHADAYGIETLKLDATDQGRPLYESLGFAVEEVIERWERPGAHHDWQAAGAPLDVNRYAALDLEAFGADRRILLRELAKEQDFSSVNGFLLARPGREAHYLGPLVCTTSAAAHDLLVEALTWSRGARWYWDLLESNPAARAVAAENGFVAKRTLWRMRRGAAFESDNSKVYGVAGFEFG